MPATDERCDACENVWLETSARRELGRWGIASTTLVSVAQWAGRAGGLGIALGILLALFPGSRLLLALWIPVTLLLLGFPLAGAAICALPFVRAAERRADLLSDDRKKFLLENKGGHVAKLLSAPSADE